MSWTERLLQLGSGRSRLSLHREIAGLCPQLLAAAERLARHARMAPHQGAERHLARLAEEDRKLAAELREALRVFGTVAPDGPAADEEADALSHWGRLCQDLNLHLALAGKLIEAANDVEEPRLVTTLRAIAESEERQLAELRDLIARADPQALD